MHNTTAPRSPPRGPGSSTCSPPRVHPRARRPVCTRCRNKRPNRRNTNAVPAAAGGRGGRGDLPPAVKVRPAEAVGGIPTLSRRRSRSRVYMHAGPRYPGSPCYIHARGVSRGAELGRRERESQPAKERASESAGRAHGMRAPIGRRPPAVGFLAPTGARV